MGEHLTFYTELKSLLNARGSFKITPLKFKDILKCDLKETLMLRQRLIKITFCSPYFFDAPSEALECQKFIKFILLHNQIRNTRLYSYVQNTFSNQ